MIINEQDIRKMVSETIEMVLSEAIDMGTIGGSGHITEAELIDPNELFKEERDMAIKIYMAGRMVDLDEVFGDTLAYQVYNNYKNAMGTANGKQPRGFLGWLKEICLGKLGQKILAFKEGDNYIFGFWIGGFFIGAYFAPATPIGKFKVIKAICQYDNIIFAVTQDLSSMLERLGIPKSDTPHSARWRGSIVQKDVFGTSQQAIDFGIMVLDMWTKA